jgi:hypothetical protein
MTDESAVLSKSPDVVSREIDEDRILIPIRQRAGDLRSVYTTEGVASSIWDLIDGERTIDEIAQLISAEYDVAPERARADLHDFAADLVETGCATWVPTRAEG